MTEDRDRKRDEIEQALAKLDERAEEYKLRCRGFNHAGHQELDAYYDGKCEGIREAKHELEALLRRSRAVIPEPPDPPHVRTDYREVWLSGWRAGVAALSPDTAEEKS